MEDNGEVSGVSGGSGQGSGVCSHVVSTESTSNGLPDVNRNPVTPKVTPGDEETSINLPSIGGARHDLYPTDGGASSGGGGVKTPQPTNHVAVSLFPDSERLPRLDVLWKVAAESETNLLPQSDASVSNCYIREMLMAPTGRSTLVETSPLTGKKFVDPPHGRNPEKEVNETLSDDLIDDKGLRVVQRSSDEEGNGCGGPCGHRNSKRGPDRPKEVRENFNWPWHRGNYRLAFRFAEPAFRVAFAQKLLLLKTLQWVVVGGWTLGAKEIPFVVTHKEECMWSLYTATLLYVLTYLAVRSTKVMESNIASLVALTLFAVSLGHILGMLYVYFDLPLIPTFVLSLLLTYAALLTISSLHPGVLDPRAGEVGIPLTLCLFLLSIAAFLLVMSARASLTAPQLTKHIGDVWFVAFALALVIATVEMVEMQTVVAGRRVPLDATDWPLAATFVF